MDDWTPDLSRSDKPRYMALADAIESDILDGLLPAGTRLPPQRRLADRLRIDFTTVARGYVEAQKRGLLVSHVGRGSFVADGAPERLRRERPAPSSFARPTSSSRTDFTMNLPPEPQDPDLLSRMETGVSAVLRNMRTLLRYQGFGGAPGDKDAASNWLGRRAMVPTQDRLFVTPGAHAALVGILSLLSSPGDVLLCEAVTYPGIRSIAAQKGLRLVGLAMDRDGILPDAFRAACRTLEPKALYLNPTLHNPTTLTIPASRRAEIARVAREFGVPIVEDDAYGFVPDHGEHIAAQDELLHVAAECFRVRLPHDPALMQYCHLVGHGFHLVQQMRAVKHRAALALQMRNEIAVELLAHNRVETQRGVVQNDQLGPMGQREHESQPHILALG